METVLEFLKAILFGIVQGITEWLPISSTGHMILLNDLVHMNVSEQFWEMFLVVIQLGSIFAVVILFLNKLNPYAPSKSLAERRDTFKLWAKILVAIIPVGIAGILLDDYTKYIYNSFVISLALIIYGVFFIIIENKNKNVTPKYRRPTQVPYQVALYIGLFQVLSLVPGTSRSGSTILGAMLLGCSRYVSAEFSFYTSIPVMFGASAIKLIKMITSDVKVTGVEWGLLIVGSLVAFIVSLFAIKFLMGYIRKHDFKIFGWYRIALGILVLLVYIIGLFVNKSPAL